MPDLKNIPWKIIPDWFKGNRLHILMYHSISVNEKDPHSTSPVVFEKHMQFLKKKQVVSLADGLKKILLRQALKDTYVITFDDGLLDFYTTALPILRHFGYPACMFLPTGLMGKTSTWDSYDTTKPLMTWQQAADCQAFDVTFGSHGVAHKRLTELAGDKIISELSGSLADLKDHLDNIVLALAYPGGYFNASVKDATIKAGYHYGLGTASHWGNGQETDPFQLRRQRLK